MLTSLLLALAPVQAVPTPLLFEENGGRYGPDVAFVARAGGRALYLHAGGFDVALLPPPDAPAPRAGVGLALRYVDADPREPEGRRLQPTRVHYLRGADPAAWSVDNATFAEVFQAQVWPGVGVRFYEASGAVEHDFVVAPGVDPACIRLAVEGTTGLTVDAAGRLVVGTPLEPVFLTAPVVTQGDARVPGAFRLIDERTFGFEIGDYDTERELVIDPVLLYATYVGGSGFDWLYDVAIDASGAVFVCGETRSSDLPTQGGVLQPALAEDYDAYVAKLSPDGSQLEWCTYLGGGDPVFPWNEDLGFDKGRAIALDSAGNVVVGGLTACADFPTTPGAWKPAQTSFQDGFVAKLSPTGDALLWSTLVGGDGNELLHGLTLDALDRVYATGEAQDGFPVTPSASQSSFGGGQRDAFVLALEADGSAPLWATFYGGSADDFGCDVEVDPLGRVYVAGISGSGNLATPGGFQPGLLGGSDGFVARLAADGALDYATYVGSSAGGELGMTITGPGLGVEPTGGRVWYAGWVRGPFAGISASAFDQTQTVSEGLAVRIDTDESGAASLLHATYVGGSGSDRLFDAEVDPDGDVWLFGGTESVIPMVEAWQLCLNSSNDDLLVELGPDGALKSSTYLGGSGSDSDLKVGRIAISPTGDVALVGRTASADLATDGSFTTTYGGGVDGLVARFSPGAPAIASATVRVACTGGAPAGSLVPNGGAPRLGQAFQVAIDDPLGETGFPPGGTVAVWALSTSPGPAAPCGLPLFGFGVGGGTGELLVGIAPAQLVKLVAPKVWGGPGVPALHTVAVPCDPAFHGLALHTQGYLASGGAIVLTDALDLVLGS